jgi:hypothetical protein
LESEGHLSPQNTANEQQGKNWGMTSLLYKKLIFRQGQKGHRESMGGKAEKAPTNAM